MFLTWLDVFCSDTEPLSSNSNTHIVAP